MEVIQTFDFDMSSVIASVIFGFAGLWLLRSGKKNIHYPHIVLGLLLMMYPYFVSGPLKTWGLGFLFSLIAYYMKDQN